MCECVCVRVRVGVMLMYVCHTKVYMSNSIYVQVSVCVYVCHCVRSAISHLHPLYLTLIYIAITRLAIFRNYRAAVTNACNINTAPTRPHAPPVCVCVCVCVCV